MAGPGTSVEFLLGSTTLSDLSDRIEFVGALAQSDEDLAQSVRNTQNELEAAQATLEVLQSKARREEAAASEARDAVLASFQEQQDLLAQIEADLNRAEQLVSKKQKSFKAWLKAQQATGYGGGHSSVPMPAGWEDVLERCPVDGPRTFGDGFGAPRYAGGYHLHKGVDMLVTERHADRGAVRRLRAVGLQLAGRQRGVRRRAVRHGLQRAPVGVLVELQRPGAGRRRDRLRGRHGRRHRHPARPLRVPPERDAARAGRRATTATRSSRTRSTRTRCSWPPAARPGARPGSGPAAPEQQTDADQHRAPRQDQQHDREGGASRLRSSPTARRRARRPPSRCRTRGRWLRTAVERSNPSCRASATPVRRG